MSDATLPAAPVTPGPAVSSPNIDFPLVTANRLQDVMTRLLKLRNLVGTTGPVEMSYAVLDSMLPDLIQCIREIQTGPSLREQWQADVALRIQKQDADAELAIAKLREESMASNRQFTDQTLQRVCKLAGIEPPTAAVAGGSP